MADRVADQNDNSRMQKRLTKLTSEKSKLELLVNMMTKLSMASGLEDAASRALESIMMVIGATNITLFYPQDTQYSTIDVFGKKQKLTLMDDPLVLAAIENAVPNQIQSAFGSTRMTYPTKDNLAFTWVYPLLIGQKLIGKTVIIDNGFFRNPQ